MRSKSRGWKLAPVAWRIAALYAAIAAAWIWLSGWLLHVLVSDPVVTARIEIYKGWVFVAVTSLLLYVTLRMYLKRADAEASERRRVEEALRSSEARFRSLVEQAPDALLVHDRSGRFLDVNRRATESLGYTREELLRMTVMEVGEEFDLPRAQAIWDQMKPGEGRVLFGRQRRKDGTQFPGEIRVGCFEEKRERLFVGLVRDISERHLAEAAIQERLKLEKDLSKLAATAPGVMYSFRLQPDGSICFPYVSPSVETLFGFSPSEILGDARRVFALIHPEDADRIDASMRRSATLLEPWREEFRIQHPRKGELWLEGRSVPEREPDGCVLWHGFFYEITDRKQAAEQMRISEERFRLIAETIDEVFWMADVDIKRVFYVSPAFERIWGRSRESLMENAKTFLDTIHAEDRARVRATMETEKGRGQPFSHEYRIVRPDGSTRWIWDRGFPVAGQDGSVLRYIGVAQDITQRKRADEARARLAAAVEQAAEAIIITDPDGIILYVNPAFEKVTGYSTREVLGKNPRLLKSGKHDAGFYRELWATLSRGEVWNGRMTNRRKDGSLYQEEITISPVHESTGKIVNYVAVKRDVTQEQALETQLRQSQKMEAIGQLAGGVAHDFNNILTVIRGHASLLVAGKMEPAECADCSHQIIRAADRATDLVRQLLLFSRKQVLQPAHINLNEVVAGMTKMLKRLLGEDIALSSDLAPSLPVIFADSGMMEQVLLNLAVNARDAMPSGGKLTIATGSETLDPRQAAQIHEARPGLHAWLEVSDTGTGIAPDVLPHIFEPFFTTKEVGKGTGLGLATVYGIVQQHHGWISVKSLMAEGTHFRIHLPAAAEKDNAGPALNAPPVLPRGTETLLVVEDETSLRALMCNILQRCGYTVLQAESGAAALELWKKEGSRVDLLLTDLIMPEGVNGGQLGRSLLEQNPRLKILYTSGYSMKAGDGIRLIEGENYLQKPFPNHKLAQTVRRRLDSD